MADYVFPVWAFRSWFGMAKDFRYRTQSNQGYYERKVDDLDRKTYYEYVNLIAKKLFMLERSNLLLWNILWSPIYASNKF